ncbi:hypothetical protein [Flavihumibacter solisilvae]|uniref:Uncharacterized protein n=1 Tax=Flavihumibacter solisilvae TaxID=1349421 RepID=A0A0C1L5W2_9BACT|nr:hypothetical protein [Flavihumibacter solisilvae]KIC95487.1 hypothetical protein OI18_06315 [Flavihumibacter solisilvae]
MRKILLSIALLLGTASIFACPVCERNQRGILKGITHGAGPESQWDYVIVWATVAIVLCSLFFSVKWLIRPGEKSGSHIKRFILNNE